MDRMEQSPPDFDFSCRPSSWRPRGALVFLAGLVSRGCRTESNTRAREYSQRRSAFEFLGADLQIYCWNCSL